MARALDPAQLTARSLPAPWPQALIIANQGLASLVNFAMTVFMVRNIGVGEFGAYSAYYLIALTVVALANSLISMPMVSLAALEHGARRGELLDTAATLVAIAVAALLALCLVGAGAFALAWPEAPLDPLRLFAFAATLMVAEFVRRRLFFDDRLMTVWVFDLLRYGLIAAAFALSIAANSEATGAHFVVAVAAANLIALGVLMVVRRRRNLSPRLRMAKDDAKLLLGNGGWLSLGTIVNFANEHLIVLIAAAMLGSHAIGAIRAPQSIVGLTSPMLFGLEYIIPKRLGQAMRESGTEAALRDYAKAGAAILAAFTALLAVIAIWAETITFIVLGAEAASYAWVLQGFCVVYWLMMSGVLTSFVYRALNNTRPILVSNFLAAMISLAISIPVIHAFGMAGAVAVIILAQLVAAALLAVFLKLRPRWVWGA
jgi:O-antigen/teichoic acid export membrane protein